MPKKGRAATPQALKPQQPKRELRYKEQYNVLASELCAQKASLQLELEQQHQAQERQKVLVDIINCQEELTRILQHHHRLLQQTSSFSASEATASPPAGLISGNNRFNRVLAAAPADLIQQVASLKQPEDWMKLATEHFREVVVLLELADRELSAVTSSPPDAAGTTGTSPAGCKEPPSESAGNAAGQGGKETAAGQDQGGLGTSAAQQLEHWVQQGLCLVGLAFLYNPAPYATAGTCNYLTGQVETAPPPHVMRVLSRLRLSDLQLLHLRIAIEEYERLSRDAQQEGGQLSEQIARLSLQQLVEDVTQQQQQEQQQIPDASANVVGISFAHPSKERQASSNLSKMSSSAAAAVAEVATDSIAADDEVRQQLMSHMNRYLGRRVVHNTETIWFILNTLTIRQVAILIVASFPYAPVVHAVAEAAKQLHKQQQQERLATIAPRVTDGELQETAEGDTIPPPPPAEEQHAQQRTESDAKCDAFDREVAEYMERRNVMLQQQVQQWWMDTGALP